LVTELQNGLALLGWPGFASFQALKSL